MVAQAMVQDAHYVLLLDSIKSSADLLETDIYIAPDIFFNVVSCGCKDDGCNNMTCNCKKCGLLSISMCSQ